MPDDRPWQLKMFDKTLKKKMKIKHLKEHLGELDGKRCFMVTAGDNNGAMNWHLEKAGGTWTWAEFEKESAANLEAFLNTKVTLLNDRSLEFPFEDGAFDRVVVIDCHEHLEDPAAFTRELARITKPGGKVIVSVPNGDEKMLAVRIKNLVGMTKEKYGHIVTGYGVPDMERMLAAAELKPAGSSQYSKFFTEMLELSINFAYVKVLAKKKKGETDDGVIAPQSEDQLKKVEKTYKVYRLVYPVFRTISFLDALLFFTKGYAVVVSADRAQG